MYKKAHRIVSFIISICFILSLAILPSSSFAAPVNEGILGLDTNADGGYEGDYVLIYNPSTSASSSLSTGSLSGKLISSSLSKKDIALPEKQSIAFKAPDVVYPAREMLFKQSITTQLFSTGQQRTFNVFPKIGSNTLVSKTFTLAASGKHCYIWYVPSETYAITLDQAQAIADEYDTKIKPLMNNNFGEFYDPSGLSKLNILVYNIQDDFGSGSNSYHSGFFWSGDLVSTYGNMAAMIHLDTYPTITYNNETSLKEAYGTIAHEMQHLISFSNYWTNTQSGSDAWASTWLDEACSMAAQEAIYPDSILESRIEQYNTYSASSYARGYSAYAWNESDISCYGINCLFGQYIKAQTGSYAAFKKLLDVFKNDPEPTDAKAVTAAFTDTPLEGKSLSEIMLAFRIALIANDPDDNNGIYGLGTSDNFDTLSIPLYTSSSPAAIYGGGAIVIKPANGVYVPPTNASAALVYVGIKLKDAEAACVLDETARTISNIPPNTTPSRVKDFIMASFPELKDVSIVGASGNYVGTGCKAYLYEEGSSSGKAYTIKIYGDLNGNGIIDISDATTIMNHVVGINTLGGIYPDAADVNHDGRITVADSTALTAHIVGVSHISQKK